MGRDGITRNQIRLMQYIHPLNTPSRSVWCNETAVLAMWYRRTLKCLCLAYRINSLHC